MKLRHLYRLFDEVNAKLFDGKIKPVKISLSKKKKPFMGLCHAEYSGKATYEPNFRIQIFEWLHDSSEEITNTLIHEMVHLYIGQKLGRFMNYNLNIFLGHDAKIFDKFGQSAVELGFLTNSDLLGAELR